MPSQKLIVTNKFGLHARPAAALAKLSSKYRSRITLHKDNKVANGKSILEILTLAAPAGSTIILTAEGEDAPQVMNDLTSLADAGFQLL